tara:strand:- start:34969 stop:36042 length:1074 start_codon:yes stop_codon:yes gene_type:complete
MTLEQYKTDIVPLVIELKKVLRKKFLIPAGYTTLQHLTHDEFIQQQIEKGEKSNKINKYNLGEEYYRSQAEKRWVGNKLKDTEIPTELHNQYKELYNKLAPLFIKVNGVDMGKIHKDHKSEVRRAISEDVYIKELKEGTIDFNLVENVCNSLGIKVPKRLYDLKEKVEQGLYNRGYITANKEFLKSIRNYLTPYTDKLRKIKRDQLEGSMKGFEDSDYSDLYDYCYKGLNRNDSLYNELYKFYDRNVKVGNIESLIQEKCKEYSDYYISNFIFRMENKTNLVNVKWGIPQITFSDTYFSGGEFETKFVLTYGNGNVITGDTKVIIAGGYIQCLHQRYLFHFYYKGKKVSLEEIDHLN